MSRLVPALVAVLFAGSVNAQDKAPEKSAGEIAKAALPAVVTIISKGPDGASTGSGFIVHKSGTIITNLHVIERATSVEVSVSNGDIFDQVRVRAFDIRRDLAIIQVPGFNLPTLRSGNSDKVQVGDRVVLIGSPKGLQGSVTSGLISAIRQLEGTRLFQTDAAANPGNSGGPMFNSKGEVIGILTFKLPDSEGLNFVVPVNYARGLWEAKEALTLQQLNERIGSASGKSARKEALPAQAKAPTPAPEPLPVPEPPLNVTGMWTGTVASTKAGNFNAKLNLRQVGTQVSGSYASSFGGTGTVLGTLNDNALSFAITSTTRNCGGTLTGMIHFAPPGSADEGRAFLNYNGATTCGGNESGKGPLTRQ